MALVLATSEGIVGGVVGAITALFTGSLAIGGERLKSRRERKVRREESFEIAQDGYRKCYRKFLDDATGCVRAERAGDLDPGRLKQLSRDFDEACMTGDRGVAAALTRYWTDDRREAFAAPQQVPPEYLIEVMAEHGSRSLDAQDALKAK